MHTNYDKLNGSPSHAYRPCDGLCYEKEAKEVISSPEVQKPVKTEEKRKPWDTKTKKTAEVGVNSLMQPSPKGKNGVKPLATHVIRGQMIGQMGGNFAFIAKNLKIFQKFVENEAKMIDSDIKLERQIKNEKIKKREETWENLKKEFKNRLVGIELARDKKRAEKTKRDKPAL